MTIVAENEAKVLKDVDYDHTFSLYVGIPFCPSICAYCSFSSYPLSVWEKQVDNYLDALCKEIEAASTMMGNKKLLTFLHGRRHTDITFSGSDGPSSDLSGTIF